ncbi:MAG: DUF4272 domain-containing protein [Mariniblastus sp.]
MNDEHFPIETLKDASAMFQFLESKTDLRPAEMELEWVFGIAAPFIFEAEAMDPLFEIIENIVDVDEESLRAEVHVVEDPAASPTEDSEVAETEEASEFLLIYTGRLKQEQLETLHQELAKSAAAAGAEYVGVECGEPGELEDIKADSFILWTEEVLEDTSNWNIENLKDMAGSIRDKHVQSLRDKGLEVADWMPDAMSRGFTQLRPVDEIVRRLMAAFATVAWVCAPDDIVSAADVKKYLADNDLQPESFSQKETEWLATPRDDVREFAGQAGWLTENIWGLGWLLGIAPTVCPCDQQVPQSIIGPIRDDFLCGFERTLEELQSGSNLQPVERIIALEDFLYCAHNGFRNAGDVNTAGLIQERRHSLTWALADGTAWDDTDVST